MIDPLNNFKSCKIWHLDIKEDQVGFKFFNFLNRLSPIPCFPDYIHNSRMLQ